MRGCRSARGPALLSGHCPRWLPRVPPSAPFLAQHICLRGRSADGSHGRGLLRVLRGLESARTVSSSLERRARRVFASAEQKLCDKACSAKANRQHHFLITHGPGALAGTEPVSASLEKKELPSEQHEKKPSKSDPELQLKITREGNFGSLQVLKTAPT